MEPAVADEHTFTLTFEASGEVTPAQPDDAHLDDESDENAESKPETEPEPEEAEQ
jgi:hypothetical protein